VILYPDASLPDKKGLTCFDEWQEKAKELSTICTTVSVSSLIEHHATEQERATGFDLADYLVRFPSF